MNIGRYVAALSLAFFLGSTLIARATELAMPSGDVLLTVTGSIDASNLNGAAVFDLEMLKALGSEEFETETIWTEGRQNFTGVPLVYLLSLLGVDEGTLRAYAINDYSVDIPVEDAVPGGPILAYLRNGTPMSIRDKGPLWIVYPYDANPAYQSEQIYARSIWQLDRLEAVR